MLSSLSPQIDGYVCLTCGVAIPEPKTDSGHLRCPDGHLLDRVKSGPLWATGVNAHCVALVAMAGVAAVFRGHWASLVVLGAFAAWSLYMVVLGAVLPREQSEIKTIAAQFIVAGLVRALAAAVVGWYVWFVIHYGHSPLWN